MLARKVGAAINNQARIQVRLQVSGFVEKKMESMPHRFAPPIMIAGDAKRRNTQNKEGTPPPMFSRIINVLDPTIEAWSLAIELDLDPPYDHAGALGLECEPFNEGAIAALSALDADATFTAVISANEDLLDLLLAILADVSEARASCAVLNQMRAVRATLAGLTPRASSPWAIN